MTNALSEDSKTRLAAMREALGRVEVEWSERDGTFRASARDAEVKHGGVLAGLCALGAATPDGAVDALWQAATDPGSLLVRDAYGVRGPRAELRYDPAIGWWRAAVREPAPV